MTNRHEEILAKSERNGSVSLYQHLKDVAELAVEQCLSKDTEAYLPPGSSFCFPP